MAGVQAAEVAQTLVVRLQVLQAAHLSHAAQLAAPKAAKPGGHLVHRAPKQALQGAAGAGDNREQAAAGDKKPHCASRQAPLGLT